MIRLVSAIVRAILPNFVLKLLRGETNSVLQRFVYTPRARLNLWWHQRRGGTYLTWYASRLDSYAQNDSVESLTGKTESERRRLDYLATGINDLDLLKIVGLRPNHTLHEIGLGHGRSAQFLVDYLDAGNYSGNDISAERVRMARELFSLKGLERKNPNLVVNEDNSFDWLDNATFDFIWANSVFGHMPPEDVEEIIRRIGHLMRPDSVFYFTVRGADPNQRVRTLSVKDWVRDHDYWLRMADRHGYTIELSDVTLPPNYVPPDARLMKLTLR